MTSAPVRVATAERATRRRPAAAPARPRPGTRAAGRALAGGTVVQRCGRPGCPCHGATAAAPERVQRKPAGTPLSAPTRSLMEARFGRDFGDVRLHTDAQTARWADRLGARAFTSGRDVFFAAGQYDPASAPGQGLLAHELTHVVQQRGGRAAAAGVDTPGDPLEREAEAVALAVERGRPVALFPGVGTPSLQRAAAAPPLSARMIQESYPAPGKLVVPGEKVSDKAGDRAHVEQLYENAAKAGALRATHAGRSLEEGRTTETLWEKWAQTRAFATPEKKDEVIAGLKASECQVDHVIELQVGGADDPSNMRVLSGRRNMTAGARINGQFIQMWTELRKAHGLPAGARPILVFSEVKVEDGAADAACLDRELTNEWPAAGPAAAKGTVRLAVLVGGNKAFIGYMTLQKGGEGGDVLKTSLYVVPGFQQRKVQKVTPKGETELTGGLSPHVRRIPFLKPREEYRFIVPQAGAKLSLVDRDLMAEFPFLSKATLEMEIEGGELRAHGILRPTLPLLRFVEIDLVIEKEELRGTARVTPEQLKRALPVPGLEITEASLGIALKGGQFTATGGFALRYSTIADGRLEARFGARGFEATGTLDLHIPGIDRATGTVWYRDAKLGGRIEIGASKLKLPGVRSANLVVSVEDGALLGTGVVQLAIPGVKEGRLGFGIDQQGNYAIAGTALLAIPGLDDATLALAYRDGDLEATARAGLRIPGLEGAAFDLRYAKGALTGSGRLSYRKGRLSGLVVVNLSERNRLSGGGELAYEIAPGLVAFAAMTITEDGRTRISGGLRVPETVELFERKQVEKTLFRLPTIEIPILAIPLGTRSIGIVATIDARMVARAGIGPGQLRKVRVLAELDPSAEESAFSFQAAAELYIPASAELAVAVAGGIGVSLALIRAVGGIEAEGAAGVQAVFIAATELAYRGGRFAVQGVAALEAQPKLVFRVKAFTAVEADLFVTTIEVYRKEWVLAAIELGSALKVGVRVPFAYVFGEPFELALDQVQFIVPPIDPVAVVKQLLPL